ncbi:hypothetical protein D3C75_373120 [compost metagenome]
MHADYAFRIHCRAGKLRQTECRRVAGQNNVARTHCIQLIEYFLLRIQVLGNGLNNHITRAELCEMCYFFNTAQNQFLLSLGNCPFLQLFVETCLDHSVRVIQSFCSFLHQHNIQALGCQHFSNPLTHCATADDTDFFKLHLKASILSGIYTFVLYLVCRKKYVARHIIIS